MASLKLNFYIFIDKKIKNNLLHKNVTIEKQRYFLYHLLMVKNDDENINKYSNSNNSIFKDFTNLYSLTKTLKFELVATPTTKKFLNFEKDKQRAYFYKKIKMLFDQLHRDFIAQSLAYYSKQNIDYQDFWNSYTAFLDAKKLKKKEDAKTQSNFKNATDLFKKIKESYRKKLVSIFNEYAENWKLELNQILDKKYPDKYNKLDKKTGKIKGCLNAKGIEVLTEAGILEVLKVYLENNKFVNEERQVFSEDEKQEMLKGINFFDKFFTYFGPFNETRENFYKDDGTSTAIPTRIIDENLVRFCDNILLAKSEIKIGSEILIPFDADIEYDKNIFELNSFCDFTDQTGINLYNGGENGDKNLGKFNSLINKYIQDNFHQNKKLPFKNLYKIMLSEKTALFEEETPESCIEILNEVDQKNQYWLDKIKINFNFIFDNKDDDEILEELYFKKDALNDLLVQFFGLSNRFILEEVIKDLGYTEKKDKSYKNFLPLLALKKAFESLGNGTYKSLKPNKKNKFKKEIDNSLIQQENTQAYKAEDLFKDELLNDEIKKNTSLWSIFIDFWKKDFEKKLEENKNFTKICKKELFDLSKYEPLKETEYKHTFIVKSENEEKIQTQANLAKLFLDSCMKLWQAMKMFELVKTVGRKKDLYYDELKSDKTSFFYESVKQCFEDFVLFKSYDKIRNFSSKKPFSTSKFKINFENSTLLDGWDLNKESDNTSIILKSPIGYELIVMNSKFNQVFNQKKNPELYQTDCSDYQKMKYKLLPGPNKMLPRVGFASVNRVLFDDIFSKYSNIEKIRKEETFKKEKLIKSDLTIWIAFYQEILNTYPNWKQFNWKFKKPEEYDDVSKFYRDVQVQGYKLSFTSVNNRQLEDFEKEGKIYRFQIKNKDWNKFSKGLKNLQTIYWEQLFTDENLTQNILKLNGEAEIFQREKTESFKFDQKIDKKDNPIFKGKTNEKVLKNGRYSENKMFFHCPITVNFSAQEIIRYNDYLEKNMSKENINYLGIDRGENHLLYYSLINSKGEIISQNSLNIFNGVDYERLLHAKQEAKKDAQDKWSVIGNIKELKAGYLSLAIGEICKIAFENNAFIILENLNSGFKKSRTIKFEKAVYQKFEVALATKLQHLVFKNKQPNELGGILNALQLTPKLDKVTDLDKYNQWGIMRYVPASYTSRICPLTGWYKTIYLKDNLYEVKKKFSLEESDHVKISFDYDLNCYTFNYDCNLKNLPNCTLYLLPETIRTTYKEKSLQTTKENELYKEMNDLFENEKDDLNDKVQSFDDKKLKKLKYIFDQLCNIRVKVNNNNEKIDVIQSPIAYDFNGEKIFFDSRKADEIGKKIGKILPVDGDANGAFHIAKKGLEASSKTEK